MARYIDADKVINMLHEEDFFTPDERWRFESEFAEFIDITPTADVVEVVRCNKCRNCEIVIDQFDNDWYFCKKTKDNAEVKPDDFCSYGERKKR